MNGTNLVAAPEHQAIPLAVWILAIVLMAAMLAAALWLPNPFLMVALPLAIPLVYVAFRLPIAVCLLFIIFSFFRIHEAFPVLDPLRIPQLLALGSFAVLLWHTLISRQLETYWCREHTLFAVFFLFVALGALLATDRASAMGMLTGSYVKIAVMVLAVSWLVRTEKDFSLAIWSILIAGALIAGVAIFNRLNGIGLVEGTRVTIGRNIGSMIGDPNDLALVLTFPLSFALAQLLFSQSGRLLRFLALLGFLAVVWAILCTQSRGGLLGILAVSGTLAWRKIENKTLVISAGVIMIPILLVAAGISDRASGGASEEGVGESAMGRIYAWHAAFNMALAHPLTGVGMDNFYANYYFYSPHWDGKNHAVHSTWFQILAETGFVGFLIFCALVIAIFRCVLRSLALLKGTSGTNTIRYSSLIVSGNALLSGLTGFCISGTFLTQGFIWPLYILLGLSIALNRAVHRTLKQETLHV